MSYLLAGGCSFTDNNYKSIVVDHDTTYDKWPTLLAKKLGIRRVLNTAKSGGSNDMIFKNVTDAIIAETPKAVFVLMTGWDRFSAHNFSINFNSILLGQVDNEFASKWVNQQEKIAVFCEAALKRTVTIDSVITTTTRQLYMLQELCNRRDIDLVVGQALNPFACGKIDELIHYYRNQQNDPKIFDRRAWAESMIDNLYFDKINHKQVTVGWPFFDLIGGFSFWQLMNKPEDYIHPTLDGHPNGSAHEKFANEFYNAYKKNYFK
jgi:hypothetical protein